MAKTRKKSPFAAAVRRYLLAGVLTVIPLWVTWLVFRFLWGLLAQGGRPAVAGLLRAIQPWAPLLVDWMERPFIRSATEVILVLLAFYLIGWVATRVLGQRLIRVFDRLMARIPLVEKVYGAVKRLLDTFSQKPGDLQRVVLINFPSPEMKAVGIITRTFTDSDTGKELVAVYVPTTPNPTSGYLEVVPREKVTPTDWTVDEAMTFIVSGGTVAPDTMHYDKSAKGEE